MISSPSSSVRQFTTRSKVSGLPAASIVIKVTDLPAGSRATGKPLTTPGRSFTLGDRRSKRSTVLRLINWIRSEPAPRRTNFASRWFLRTFVLLGSLRPVRPLGAFGIVKSPALYQSPPLMSTAHPALSRRFAKLFRISGEPSIRTTCLPITSLMGRSCPSSTRTVRSGLSPKAIPASNRTFGRAWPIGCRSGSSSPLAYSLRSWTRSSGVISTTTAWAILNPASSTWPIYGLATPVAFTAAPH